MYLPQLDLLEKEIVSIPCGWWLTPENINYIVHSIKTFDNEYKINISLLSSEKLFEYLELLSELNDIDPASFIQKDIEYNNIYVLTVNDVIVSSLKLLIEEKMYDSVAHIEDIVTKPQYRGLGFAKKVIKYVKNIVTSEKQCYKIVLSAKKELEEFYLSCDFEISGTAFTSRF